MKTALKFKGGDFRFKPHFNQIEFEILGVEGRATGRLTHNDCLSLGKYLMDVYYSRAMRPGDGSETPESDSSS